MPNKRPRLGIVVGFDYHARYLANLINEQATGWRLRAFRDSRVGILGAIAALSYADALICFGGPAPNGVLVEAARRRNTPILVIWAGNDVTKAAENPFDLEILKQEAIIHLSEGPWLLDELLQLGIHAEYLPVTTVQCGSEPPPLPKQLRILTYLPEPRRAFYGEEVVYEAARRFPDVEFSVVGEGRRNPVAPGNVTFHGYVREMQRYLDSSTALLRFPEHDGKSALVLEALARARHVIWNHPFPHVRAALDAAHAYEHIAALQALHNGGRLQPNVEGREYVLREFDRSEIAHRFARRLDHALAHRAHPRPAAKHRVAISGLGLFCAEVAEHTRAVAPDWEPRFLRTGSRFEVLSSIWSIATSDLWYSIGSPVTDRWVSLAARLLRKPRVIHWVGSDIAALCRAGALRSYLSSNNIIHLAEVEWTAEQLRSLRLRVRLAALPPRHRTIGALPLPEHFTVMLYVPRTRSEFYGRRSFERLMRRLRERAIRYVIVGGGDLSVPEGVDAKNLGWRDRLEDVYANVTVLIRNTERDGLSLMVLEALSFGRHVLWTQTFPFTRCVHSYGEIERVVLDLLQMHERGELEPQSDASAMIGQQYSMQACMRTIIRAWEEAIRLPEPSALTMEAARDRTHLA